MVVNPGGMTRGFAGAFRVTFPSSPAMTAIAASGRAHAPRIQPKVPRAARRSTPVHVQSLGRPGRSQRQVSNPLSRP